MARIEACTDALVIVIDPTDPQGISLAAIKAVRQQVVALEARVAALDDRSKSSD